MIMVDVFVPSLNKTYDFGIEEEARVSSVIEEIVEMVCQKEQCKIIGDEKTFLLCCADSQRVLKPQSTILANNIQTGNRLILV